MKMYYIRNSGELCHWEIKRDHKYIARVELPNGKYRYFYDKDEYQAYLDRQKKSKSENGKSIISKFVDKFSKLKLSVTSSLTPIIINPTSKFVDLIRSTKLYNDRITSKPREGHKYIAKVKLSNGEYRYFYDQDEYDTYLKRQEYQENEPYYMSDLKRIDGPRTFEEDAMAINENYKVFGDGEDSEFYSMNCMLCTTAYELRRRGYDVEAKPATPATSDQVLYIAKGVILSARESTNAYARTLFKDPVIKDIDLNKKATLKEQLESEIEPNTRGNLLIQWNSGGGHSIIYESDSKGNITLIDSQTSANNFNHSIMTTADDMQEYMDKVKEIRYMRTDNLELTRVGVELSVQNRQS